MKNKIKISITPKMFTPIVGYKRKQHHLRIDINKSFCFIPLMEEIIKTVDSTGEKITLDDINKQIEFHLQRLLK